MQTTTSTVTRAHPHRKMHSIMTVRTIASCRSLACKTYSPVVEASKVEAGWLPLKVAMKARVATAGQAIGYLR